MLMGNGAISLPKLTFKYETSKNGQCDTMYGVINLFLSQTF